VATPTSTVTYAYDLTGNRTNRTINSSSTGFTIAATSNRLTGLTGATVRSFTWDAAGHVTSDGTATFTFDNAGRRVTAAIGGQTWSYAYNALGQRVKKAGPAGATTLFAYDGQGHLLGEYTALGAPIREYVWLGDTLVAVLTPNGTVTDISYVHADQRNVPRLVTRSTDNAIRWRWEAEAFGDSLPDENPAGLGAFMVPLRDPGQVFDAETGLVSNGFRDYRPSAGRYDEVDPIGLAGGSWSPLVYVNDNPLRGVAPMGLDWVYSQTTGQIVHVDNQTRATTVAGTGRER
jgi:RHS repeat-associated protein